MNAPPDPAQLDAVLFDMDGVLVDSEPLHERAFLEVFAELGYGETHGMNLADYLGQSDRAVWEDFVAKHHPPQSIAELTALKERRWMELLRTDGRVFPGMSELARALAGRYRLALASSSVHAVIDAVLELTGLRDVFAAVASVQDVGRAKPAPDIFLHAARLLDTPPARCCVIEDTLAGVAAAQAAGMTVVALPHTYPVTALTRAGATVAASAAELRSWLLPETARETAA
jgi:HAD superfamily hydrolase (TIGR01509 family)